MPVLIYVFSAAGLILVLWGVSSSIIERKTMVSKLPQERPELKKKKLSVFLAVVFPFSKTIVEKLKLDVQLKNKLDAAHSTLKPPEFFSLKLLLSLGLVVLTFFVVKKVEVWMLLFPLLIGAVLPDMWLNAKISKRKYSIVRVLPETVDLLGLCVEAGLDFTTAVKWLIDKTPRNPMIEELALVLEQIKWGRPRTQALKDMAKRLNVSEITSLVQTMVQAERMGTPVAQTFSMLSEDTRQQRFNRGERVALKAPIKMLVPLIFCILPVIGIVVGGPILLQFMQGSFLKGF